MYKVTIEFRIVEMAISIEMSLVFQHQIDVWQDIVQDYVDCCHRCVMSVNNMSI